MIRKSPTHIGDVLVAVLLLHFAAALAQTPVAADSTSAQVLDRGTTSAEGELPQERLVRLEERAAVLERDQQKLESQRDGLLTFLIALLFPAALLGYKVKLQDERARQVIRDEARRIKQELETDAAAFKESFATETKNAFDLTEQLEHRSLLAMGRLHLSEKNKELPEAIHCFTEVLKRWPSDARASYYRAQAFRSKGREYSTQTADDFEVAIESPLYKEDPVALLMAADAFFAAGRTSKARESAESALKYGSRDRARALTVVGRCKKKEAIDKGWSREGIDAAIRTFDECLSLYPDHFDAISEKVGIFLFQGRFHEAVQTCNTAINSRPTNAMLYMWRAQAKWARNRGSDRDAAMEDIDEAIRLNPRQTQFYDRKAHFLEDRAMLAATDAARERFLRSAKRELLIGKGYAHVHHRGAFRNRLCAIHLLLGEVSEAADEAQGAVNDNPRWTANWLSVAAMKLVERDFGEAAKAAARGLALAGRKGEASWAAFYALLAGVLQQVSRDEIRSLEEQVRSRLEADAPWQPTSTVFGPSLVTLLNSASSFLRRDAWEAADRWRKTFLPDRWERHEGFDVDAGDRGEAIAEAEAGRA